MPQKFSIATLFSMLFDFLGALLLAIYGMFVGPLGILRGSLVFERTFLYVGVFVPMGVLARFVRVAIEWRLGHFDVAIAQAESLTSSVEQYYNAKPTANMRKRVLMDLYTLLTRAYLHIGRIDEAMQIIIRAKKVIGIDRLIGLAELDAKTAHLIRAGLAAGRLLDGGGLATMFVKSELKPDKSPSRTPASVQSQRGVADSDKSKDNGKQHERSAKIIPFPQGDCVV